MIMISNIASTEIKLVGKSLGFQKKLTLLRKLAQSDKNVLILGETGTGKDFTAKVLHGLCDQRKNKPFVTINCAAIPLELFEAELFGYKRGAFTGAVKEKAGLLEVARDGTVFLDEIGELPLYLQPKFLRVIESKEMRRIGGTSSRKIRARLIFATNKNLVEEINGGRFRKDLFYRINVVRLFLPPLKERKEDIPFLVEKILGKESQAGSSKKEISSPALKKLMAHDFPGNIRELENLLERACLLSEEDILKEDDIQLDWEISIFEKNQGVTPEHLRKTLEKCHWNKTRAAEKIGKSRRQFYRLLEKYNMQDCLRQN